jgi:hypothetical protein
MRKSWFDGNLYTLGGCSHSWQRSFESGQVITIVPIAFFHFIHREINLFYGQLNYRFNDCVNFGFTGDYSKDTLDYTMWTIRANLNWSF